VGWGKPVLALSCPGANGGERDRLAIDAMRVLAAAGDGERRAACSRGVSTSGRRPERPKSASEDEEKG